jgi:hypothetical protein
VREGRNIWLDILVDILCWLAFGTVVVGMAVGLAWAALRYKP